MSDYSEVETALKARLVELTARAEEIEDDLRHPLDADSEEQAIDLADDEALAGVDTVLRNEIMATRAALQRIEDGTYGTCANCGGEINEMRLKAQPTATLCINCA
ncbi:hypothetical protein SZ64_17910 [Erythrobacter sp. SG61-1L]|uniref:TraR/DksA family transcriptional regulator n=1 Tax=Erythrobacter sp. SG61-1L TaxID=1603897 RepID=UPI0006C91F2E|nr:TraR/DksA C4-type zinc finger protein [Erythrobacter sp. SG61-1L]KPL69738.1 hypothetical protein SZ64_17535 [Erythrobacter sp. SG61-1L]KPL69809.1 hypothetical protein SZ64_17910 [Erythrobacter sp. SG61-1L]